MIRTTKKYPPVVLALQALGHEAVLDSEMVGIDKEGRPSFNAVQLNNGHNTPITYYVFKGYLAARKRVRDTMKGRPKISVRVSEFR